MFQVSWQDFDTDSALERNLLERALPLVAIQSTGDWRATIDMTRPEETTTAHVQFTEVIGATPERCVDLLQIRPLLLGTAWKVLDLLLEEALAEAGEQPDQKKKSRWSIERKKALAQKGAGKPGALSISSWRVLTLSYVLTVDLRHSLTHRSVFTDPTGALVGHDDDGNPIRPMPPEEQVAFVRAVLRAAQLVLAPASDDRIATDLVRQLGALTGLHGVALPAVQPSEMLREITAIVGRDPAAPGHYVLDVSALRVRVDLPAGAPADVIVQLKDRPGQELRGRLEHAPEQVVLLDPAAPPSWLS
jgi:hypothetical protein